MKKIMFNDKYRLTNAVLEGRKTQTRREIDIPEGEELEPCYFKGALTSVHLKSNPMFVLNPAYRVGEEVAVAQSYFDCGYSIRPRSIANTIQYSDGSAGWNNKMFVRADLMPYRIKITNVRVERLQDISDEDCLKEGIEFVRGRYYTNYNKETNSRTWLGNTPKEAFAALIDKICGKGTWDSNHWVFVYDFQLIK